LPRIWLRALIRITLLCAILAVLIFSWLFGRRLNIYEYTEIFKTWDELHLVDLSIGVLLRGGELLEESFEHYTQYEMEHPQFAPKAQPSDPNR
jgi:hypothetical protein